MTRTSDTLVHRLLLRAAFATVNWRIYLRAPLPHGRRSLSLSGTSNYDHYSAIFRTKVAALDYRQFIISTILGPWHIYSLQSHAFVAFECLHQ